MKKLFSFLILVLSVSLQAQISTQKVNNTAVIYETNSTVYVKGTSRFDGLMTISNMTALGTNTATAVKIGTITMSNDAVVGLTNITLNNGVGGKIAFVLTNHPTIFFQDPGGSGRMVFNSGGTPNFQFNGSVYADSILASLGGEVDINGANPNLQLYSTLGVANNLFIAFTDNGAAKGLIGFKSGSNLMEFRRGGATFATGALELSIDSGLVVVSNNFFVGGSFNQIPSSYSMQNQTILGNSNFITFAHGTVPSNMTLTINHVQSILENGQVPGTNQIVRIFDASNSSTLLATNGNWNGTITITNFTRWYARFENNSTTNVPASASIHGNLK